MGGWDMFNGFSVHVFFSEFTLPCGNKQGLITIRLIKVNFH